MEFRNGPANIVSTECREYEMGDGESKKRG